MDKTNFDFFLENLFLVFYDEGLDFHKRPLHASTKLVEIEYFYTHRKIHRPPPAHYQSS
jgi:hypothetical protein